MISTNDVLTAVSVISTLCAIVFGYVAFVRTRKLDHQQEGEKNASVFIELSYIKGGMDEVKRKMELQEKRHLECSIQLARVETSVNRAHNRLDSLASGSVHGERKEGG